MSLAGEIAARYLWARRREAFITIITVVSILGVAIGVMVLNIVMAVMTGFQYELRERIVSANAHIVVRTSSGVLGSYERVAQQIASVHHVVSASPFTYHQGLVRSGSRASGILVKGIAEGSAAATEIAAQLPEDESIAALFAPPPLIEAGEARNLPGMIIGREFERTFGVRVGDTVTLLAPEVSSSPFGLIPRFKRFMVVGVYSSGLVGYESGLAYVALPTAQQFFGLGDGATGIEVRIDDLDLVDRVLPLLRAELSSLGSDWFVTDWREMNRPLFEALTLERRVYFIVLLLIVVMASFSIVTTLVMIVIEKRRDIALLKAMGATSGTIAMIFRLQGAVIGLIGTVSGSLLGVVGSLLLKEIGFPLDEKVFGFSQAPVRLETHNVVITSLSAFVICFLATWYPARRASRLQPSELLRFE